MLRIAILIGSTRPTRVGPSVAQWVFDHASTRDGDAEYELVDLADFDLPLLDEPISASRNRYSKDHTKRWSKAMAGFDAYVFVTPEYNHGVPGALKNAFDFLFHEWTNKAVAFAGYGSIGAQRAVEQWRAIVATAQMADVSASLALTLAADVKDGQAAPEARHEKTLATMLDQLEAWGAALKSVREKAKAKKG